MSETFNLNPPWQRVWKVWAYLLLPKPWYHSLGVSSGTCLSCNWSNNVLIKQLRKSGKILWRQFGCKIHNYMNHEFRTTKIAKLTEAFELLNVLVQYFGTQYALELFDMHNSVSFHIEQAWESAHRCAKGRPEVRFVRPGVRYGLIWVVWLIRVDLGWSGKSGWSELIWVDLCCLDWSESIWVDLV